MSDRPIVTVHSRKFDGSMNRSWNCDLLSHSDEEIVLKGVFPTEVPHSQLGKLDAGTISYEYFWPARWYNVFRFHEPSGEFRNYYCNITTPPTFDGQTVDYVDLDIDVLVWPDGRHEILDWDEFDANSARWNYPLGVIEKVHQSLEVLLKLIAVSGLPN